MVYTVLVPAVPQRFNCTGICLRFSFFLLPLLPQSLAIFQKQNTEDCTIITRPRCIFPAACLPKNQVQKIAKGKNWVACHAACLKCSANAVYAAAQGQWRGTGAHASSLARVTLKQGISLFNTYMLSNLGPHKSKPVLSHGPSVIGVPASIGSLCPCLQHQAGVQDAPRRDAPRRAAPSVGHGHRRGRERCPSLDSAWQIQHCSKTRNPPRKATCNSWGSFSLRKECALTVRGGS